MPRYAALRAIPFVTVGPICCGDAEPGSWPSSRMRPRTFQSWSAYVGVTSMCSWVQVDALQIGEFESSAPACAKQPVPPPAPPPKRRYLRRKIWGSL